LSKYKNVKRFILNEKSLIKMDTHDVLNTACEGQFLTWVESASEYLPTDRFQNGAKFGSEDAYAELTSGGELVMTGSASFWLDTNIPVTALGRGANSPDFVSFLSGGNIQGLGFDGVATTEQVFGSFEVAHGYLESSTFYPHIHWMPTTSACGDVVWQLELACVAEESGAAFPDTVDTFTVTTKATGTAWYAKEADFVNSDSTVGAPGTGIKPGTTCLFRIYRDPTDGGDTYGADAALVNFGVDFEVHRLGEPTRLNPEA
jgi:hypothetical protein